jgi:hypothetical protein
VLSLDLEGFAKAARWDLLPQGMDPLELAETVNDPTFPGAILPAVDSAGVSYWYGAAATGAEWRLLQPMLVAFVGPTVTSFSGQPAALEPKVAAENLLVIAGVYAAARLVPGPGCGPLALRALCRLRKAVALRPMAVSATPVSTPQLIARVEMCLAVGDRAGADRYLETLRAELRLDTLNLYYLEVRILSTFRAWRELISKEWFAALAVARKPSAVAAAMLEALWYGYLSDVPEGSPELERRYHESAQMLVRPLLGQVPSTTVGIIAKLRNLDGGASPEASTPGPAAQEMLDQAAEAPSVGRNAEARTAIAALLPGDRATLLESGAGQRALEELDRAGEIAPANWVEWLDLLGDARFTHAAAVARDGVREWPVENITTQEQAKLIAEALIDIGLSADQSRDRLIESIPSLIHWVKTDPEYPRSSMREVYVALLQVLGLLDSRSSADRDAGIDLLEACLALGVTPALYRQLLTDFRGLIDPGAGRSSIYWLIDLAAILLEHPSPDANGRLEFLNGVLNSFQPFVRVLTPGQRAAYDLVAATAGWPTLAPPEEVGTAAGLQWLEGKSVAIYTLTESAGRQAEAAIREQAPSAKVELAHDHVATPRLARLARDVDVFVLAAASAKHAATDCILNHRGEKALLYAPGRGFCGILRVLEDYLARRASDSTVK